MKQNFKAALDFVLNHECVYAAGHYGDLTHVVPENVPGDAGGLTKFGIDQRSHPNINIKALTCEQAKYIYQEEEWTKCRCDDLPAGYDIAVFDCAVNNGTGTAIKLLQKSLNDFGAGLEVDGFIGPKTLHATSRFGKRGLENFLRNRDLHYRAIAQNNPSQEKFLHGWLERVNDLGETLATKGAAYA